MDDTRLSFKRMHVYRALPPHTGASLLPSSEKFISQLRQQRDAPQKETTRMEKKNGRRRAASRTTGRAMSTSRTISGSLTPPTVLSGWSFIFRRHGEKEWEENRRVGREKEKADVKLRELSGFCNISRDIFLLRVSLSAVSAIPSRSYSRIHPRNQRNQFVLNTLGISMLVVSKYRRACLPDI